MVKKGVPDWLNSSLWSAPPRLHSDYSVKSAASAIVEPPSVPAQPSAAVRPSVHPVTSPARAARREIRDPLGGHSGNNSVYCSDDDSGCSSANSIGSVGGGSGAAAVAATLSAEDVSRRAQILQELSRKIINMGELRRLASQGIPDGGGIRPTVWKLLLGYLPTDCSLWPSELGKKRSQYKNFKEELLMSPSVRDYQEVGKFKY